MLTGLLSRVRGRLGDESGQSLIIMVGALLTILALASYGIDVGIWHVHGRHLQTQADAGALAGAQQLARAFQDGSCTDTNVTSAVNTLDGIRAYSSSSSSATLNAQVSQSPSSSTTHNLYDNINQASYYSQSIPNDSGLTGSPCTDAAVDAKLTETNLPSLIPFVTPAHLNKQARVSLLKITDASGALPIALPAATPCSVSVELVNESNGAVVGGPTTIGTCPGDGTTTVSGSVNLLTSALTGGFPMGLVVATSGDTASFANSSCFNLGGSGSGGSAVSCYGTGSATNGLVTTHVWKRSTASAVETGDVWFAAATKGNETDCSSGPSGAVTNFFSAATNLTMCASMFFPTTSGTTLDCSKTGNVSMSVKYGTTTTAMNCPSDNNPSSTAAYWWAPVTVPAITTSSGGGTSYDFSWTVTAGNAPSNGTPSTGTCGTGTGKKATPPCTGTLSTVQRTFAGPYDSVSETYGGNQSGPITSATVTYNNGTTTTAPLQSMQLTTLASLTSVNVALNLIGFKNSQQIGSGSPTKLASGGNQAIGTVKCGNNGNNTLTAAFTSGCSYFFTTTSLSTSDPNLCTGAGTTASPYTCATDNGGSAKSTDVDNGMQARIGTGTCTNPNYWTTPNTNDQVLTHVNTDPRFVTILITDYGGLGNGQSVQHPIRHFARFYVTGYNGDPCTTAGTGSNGLAYTASDAQTYTINSGEIYGHFINDVEGTNSGAIGSGTSCKLNSLDECVEVITR